MNRDRKTKQIVKDRFIKRQERPHKYQPYRNPINRRYQQTQTKQININRQQQCPFLARIFYSINQENYYKGKSITQLPLDRQLKVHLWMNSTLKQISQLIRAMLPSVRTKQKFTFWRLFYSKQKKQYEKQQLGFAYTSKRWDKVQQQALLHTKFKIGDMIDVSITYK